MTPQEIVIPVDSQELADELKEICIKYGLPIWKYVDAFKFNCERGNYFQCVFKEFWIPDEITKNKTQITKEQFIELLDNINN